MITSRCLGQCIAHRAEKTGPILCTYMNAFKNSPFRFIFPNSIFGEESTCQVSTILQIELVMIEMI